MTAQCLMSSKETFIFITEAGLEFSMIKPSDFDL